MRCVRIDINDFRMLTELTIHAKALNVFSGDNDLGKTSVLKAIASVFEGGHQPNAIRQGAKRAQVKLTLDNGTTILRTITPKTSTLEIKTADGMEVPKPETFVKTLASGFSFDPLAFITAKPKERLAYLQRALNISFEPEEVAAITGPCGLKPATALDLDGINAIRKQVYDMRTQQNTLAKQADGTVERLTGTIAEDEATDWDAEVKRIQAQRDEAMQALTDAKKAVENEAEIERKRANKEADDKIAEINRERGRVLEAVNVAEKTATGEVEENARPVMDKLNQDLGTAQANAKRKAQNEIVKREIETAAEARDQHKAQSQALTGALGLLDALKQKKLDALPIENVEMRDGDFYVGGIAFDDLNDGQKFLKAFEVGALLPNPLGMMCADRSEILGPKNWEPFKVAAVQSGFQVFCSRVTEGGFKVETVGELEVVAQ